MKIFKSLSLALCAVILVSGCSTLETKLEKAERDGRLPEVFWLAHKKFRKKPQKEKFRYLFKEYGYRTIDYLLAKADREFSQNEFDKLYATLYEGSNSAKTIIRAYESAGFSHPYADRPDMMKAEIDRAREDFYKECLAAYAAEDFDRAIAGFRKIASYKNSSDYLKSAQNELDYENADKLFKAGKYRSAFEQFSLLSETFRDVAEKKKSCVESGKIYVELGPIDKALAPIEEDLTNVLKKDAFIDLIKRFQAKKFENDYPGRSFVVTARVVDEIIDTATVVKDTVFHAYALNGKYESADPKQNSRDDCRKVFLLADKIAFDGVVENKKIDFTVSVEILDGSGSKKIDFCEFDISDELQVDYYRFKNESAPISKLIKHDPSKDTVVKCRSARREPYDFSDEDLELQKKFDVPELQSDDELRAAAIEARKKEIVETLRAKIIALIE